MLLEDSKVLRLELAKTWGFPLTLCPVELGVGTIIIPWVCRLLRDAVV